MSVSVTVLLPVYNGAATLEQTLRSILRQRHRDFELLVIDDASTDDSAAVIRRWAGLDMRVVPVFHDRNSGLANTLNEGLERARHEFVARIDQDDEALPDRLETQVAFLESHPSVAAAGSWVYHMGTDRRRDRLVRLPVEHHEIAARLPRENCMYHPSVMLRRSVVLDAGGYRGAFRNAEDYDLWLRLARRAELANVPKPLLRYRFSVDGMTLGRKWQQLFYIHLAQAAGGDAEMPLDEAERRARATFAAVDRREFLTYVAVATVKELAALGHWRDAAVVAARFAKDIGPRASARLVAEIGRAGARERKIPGLRRLLA
jgi:glycosyltransferase involved in cell wall biosynthesis